ncbi:MAG: hypothetical protein U5N86_04960 [Planctomycetota bacterium]|nr:hypothetical protein [Planctomycetota bacterium]
MRSELAERVEAECEPLNEKHFKKFARNGVFFLENDGMKMKYFFRSGKGGRDGSPLYLCFHQGGGSKDMNDSCWSGMQGYYSVKGSLIVPRVPTDAVGGWNKPHIPGLVQRALYESFVLRDIDTNRVYILGYSLGGYGTAWMGPLMADRWAAFGSSAAGIEPSGAPLVNLRNTPVIIQAGTEDNTPPRYETAKRYVARLNELHEADEEGYIYKFREHQGAGHIFSDSDSPKWVGKHVREPYPEKVVWKPVSSGSWSPGSFYWLAGDGLTGKVVVTRDGNTIEIEEGSPSGLTLLLNEEFIDFDEPVVVKRGDEELFNGKVTRSLAVMIETYVARADKALTFTAKITLD